MLLPWDSAEAAAALSPADRMKLKLKHVAANRAARQEAGEGTRGSSAGGSAEGSAGPAKKRAREYAFAVDAADHCETPGEAYEDVVPFLRQLAAQLGKEPRELAIYDPYYCNGAVVAHLGARGLRGDDDAALARVDASRSVRERVQALRARSDARRDDRGRRRDDRGPVRALV